jgi:hypothetical protein
VILLISSSWVARITGVSHQHLANIQFLYSILGLLFYLWLNFVLWIYKTFACWMMTFLSVLRPTQSFGCPALYLDEARGSPSDLLYINITASFLEAECSQCVSVEMLFFPQRGILIQCSRNSHLT